MIPKFTVTSVALTKQYNKIKKDQCIESYTIISHLLIAIMKMYEVHILMSAFLKTDCSGIECKDPLSSGKLVVALYLIQRKEFVFFKKDK